MDTKKLSKEGDDSGVSSVENDSKVVFSISGGTVYANGSDEVEVYDLTGARVRNSGLTKGIYVVRAAGKVAKVMVK